jgi:hypothetical protein
MIFALSFKKDSYVVKTLNSHLLSAVRHRGPLQVLAHRKVCSEAAVALQPLCSTLLAVIAAVPIWAAQKSGENLIPQEPEDIFALPA